MLYGILQITFENYDNLTTKLAEFVQLISTEPTFFNNKIKIVTAKNFIEAKNLHHSEVKVTILSEKDSTVVMVSL